MGDRRLGEPPDRPVRPARPLLRRVPGLHQHGRARRGGVLRAEERAEHSVRHGGCPGAGAEHHQRAAHPRLGGPPQARGGARGALADHGGARRDGGFDADLLWGVESECEVRAAAGDRGGGGEGVGGGRGGGGGVADGEGDKEVGGEVGDSGSDFVRGGAVAGGEDEVRRIW